MKLTISSLKSRFFYLTQKSRQKCKHLENEKSKQKDKTKIKIKQKAFWLFLITFIEANKTIFWKVRVQLWIPSNFLRCSYILELRLYINTLWNCIWFIFTIAYFKIRIPFFFDLSKYAFFIFASTIWSKNGCEASWIKNLRKWLLIWSKTKLAVKDLE